MSTKQRQKFATQVDPELIEAVRGTLTGNAATLEKHFNVKLSGSAALWTLTLVPRDGRLASQVRELQIVGQRGELRTLELSLSGGDRSLMTIEALPPAVPAAPSR